MATQAYRVRSCASFLAEVARALEEGASHLGERLVEEIERFWPDEPRTFEELELLGALGALESEDPADFVDEIAHAAAEPPGGMRLATVHVERREEILGRLRLLAASPTRRRAYLELVREVATAAGASWTSGVQARAAARAATLATTLERALEQGTDPLGTAEIIAHRGTLELLIGLTEPAEVVLVPSECETLRAFDVPGRLIVLVPPSAATVLDRARTGELARRARAIADPTRLALLDAIAETPTSVGELARRFALSQPTVSNHLRQLREAGLVTEMRVGGRHILELDEGAIAALGAEIAALGASRTPK